VGLVTGQVCCGVRPQLAAVTAAPGPGPRDPPAPAWAGRRLAGHPHSATAPPIEQQTRRARGGTAASFGLRQQMEGALELLQPAVQAQVPAAARSVRRSLLRRRDHRARSLRAARRRGTDGIAVVGRGWARVMRLGSKIVQQGFCAGGSAPGAHWVLTCRGAAAVAGDRRTG